MRSAIRVCVTLVLCAVSAVSARAHELVAPGKHVRISMSPGSGNQRSVLQGRVRSVDDRAVVVSTLDGDVALSWGDIRTLDVATRRSRRCGAVRGAVIGLVGGAVVGAAVGLSSRGDQLFSSTGAAFFGAIGFGSMGATAGGLAGIASPCVTWEHGDAPRLTVQPMPSGVGARLSLRF